MYLVLTASIHTNNNLRRYTRKLYIIFQWCIVSYRTAKNLHNGMNDHISQFRHFVFLKDYTLVLLLHTTAFSLYNPFLYDSIVPLDTFLNSAGMLSTVFFKCLVLSFDKR